MERFTYWLCFACGFSLFFVPLLLMPNGWLFVFGPFFEYIHRMQIAIYGAFILACVLALCEKEWARGWVIGSFVSAVIGTILFFTIGLGLPMYNRPALSHL